MLEEFFDPSIGGSEEEFSLVGNGDHSSDRRASDLSLTQCWVLADVSSEPTGLPFKDNAQYRVTRNSALQAAVQLDLNEPGRWISYSRNRNRYNSQNHALPRGYSYPALPNAVDELASLGLVEHDLAPVGRLGRQSRFRATDAAHRMMRSVPAANWAVPEFGPLLRLKGPDKKLLSLPDTRHVRGLSKDVAKVNEMLNRIKLDLPGQRFPGTPFFRFGSRMLDVRKVQVYRVFNNGSFSQGGRFFGHFVQSMPSAFRADLKLFDMTVAEPDFVNCNPRILYAMVGRHLEGDAYAMDEYRRDLVKSAFNTMVHARDEKTAVWATAGEMAGEGADMRRVAKSLNAARQLLAVIHDRHRAISGFFSSGVGMRCMNIESAVANRVLLALIRKGISAIPVHDSFVCRDVDKGLVREIMDQEMDKMLRQLRAKFT
jgi:hypothetical protein